MAHCNSIYAPLVHRMRHPCAGHGLITSCNVSILGPSRSLHLLYLQSRPSKSHSFIPTAQMYEAWCSYASRLIRCPSHLTSSTRYCRWQLLSAVEPDPLKIDDATGSYKPRAPRMVSSQAPLIVELSNPRIIHGPGGSGSQTITVVSAEHDMG